MRNAAGLGGNLVVTGDRCGRLAQGHDATGDEEAGAGRHPFDQEEIV